MPLNRTFTGVWSVGWDLYAELAVICDSISHSYNLDVSPANVMGGSGNMLIKSIGNVTPNISIKGPILFSQTGYQRNLGMGAPGVNAVLDAYGYSQYITQQAWNVIGASLSSDAFLLGDTILNSVEMSISSEGASVNTSWYLDFLADNPNGATSGDAYPAIPSGEGGGEINRGAYPAGEIWLTENYLAYPNNLVPLRKGQWYDFLVKSVGNSGTFYLVIKDFRASLKPEYQDFNPVGGYIHPNNGQRVWSVPIKILKGVNLTYDLTTLIPVNQGYPGWGRAKLTYYVSGGTNIASYAIGPRVTTQPANYFNYLSGDDIQVDFLYPSAAPNVAPNFSLDIVDALMVDSNLNGLVRVGYINKSISNNLIPGLCEGKLTAEFLLRPPQI